jgi:hypothetical protein
MQLTLPCYPPWVTPGCNPRRKKPRPGGLPCRQSGPEVAAGLVPKMPGAVLRRGIIRGGWGHQWLLSLRGGWGDDPRS